MSNCGAGYDVLFGIRALQADLIDPGRFAEACAAWAACPDRSLPDLLLQRGWLTAQDRDRVDRLLQRECHGDSDPACAELTMPSIPGSPQAPAGQSNSGNQSTMPAAVGVPDASQAKRYVRSRGGRPRYTLNRLHAQGGVGRVWCAHDDDLGRQVALKELRPDRAAHPAVWARFLKEARITGQLEHPGIVPVYELSPGSPSDPPFYAMRLIQGRTLSEVARAYHEKRQAGQASTLDLRALLSAFVTVCNTVAYAHARGVLHRDLKGHNVVLGDFGEVIVLDWGLAKVIAEEGDEEPATLPRQVFEGITETDTLPGPVTGGHPSSCGQTAQGDVLGTPSYMAPEQAAGQLDRIDRRTDVYGLGAILYEILTGRPPYAPADPVDVLDRVLSAQPERPRQLVAATPRALEAICLKALARQPEERYGSAEELAREVQRFLADEPVTAWGESLPARLARWGRRHRTLAASAAIMLATTLVALTAGTLLLSRANGEIQQQRDEARRHRDLAQENFRRARRAVDESLTLASENTLLRSPLPGLQPLRKQLLEAALRYYREFLQQRSADPLLQAELAAAFFRVGKITAEIGSKADALTAFEQARDLYERLAQAQPEDSAVQAELGKTYGQVGLMQHQTGRPEAALDSLARAVAIDSQLAKVHPDDLALQREQASAYRNLGSVQHRNGQREAGLQSYQMALDVLDQLPRAHHTAPAVQKERAGIYLRIGSLQHFAGHSAVARRHYQEAVSIWEQLYRSDPTDPEFADGLALSYNSLSWLRSLRETPAAALPSYQQVLALREKLARDNPTVTAYQTELARVLTSLGEVYRATGQIPEAMESHQRAIRIREQLVRENPNDTPFQLDLAWSYCTFAYVQFRTDYLVAALALYEQARRLIEPLADKHPGDGQVSYILSMCHAGIGRIQAKHGQMAEARQSWDQAIADLARLKDDWLDADYDRACWWALRSSLGSGAKDPISHREGAHKRNDADQAMSFLRRAVDAENFSLHSLRTDPDLDALRSRPDFKELLQKVEARTQSAER
jgi:serine/threonine-protein kinase